MNIAELGKLRVDQLTPEEIAELRKWFLTHRSWRSVLLDEKRASRIPRRVSTWLKHPNRYDIPGVDTPSAMLLYEQKVYPPTKPLRISRASRISITEEGLRVGKKLYKWDLRVGGDFDKIVDDFEKTRPDIIRKYKQGLLQVKGRFLPMNPPCALEVKRSFCIKDLCYEEGRCAGSVREEIVNGKPKLLRPYDYVLLYDKKKGISIYAKGWIPQTALESLMAYGLDLAYPTSCKKELCRTFKPLLLKLIRKYRSLSHFKKLIERCC